MARGTRNQASGSQPAPSQSQRRRRREQDDDEAEDYTQATQAMDVDGDEGDNNEELQRKVNDLVRLALFSEHRRVPLKRDEINKKVFGSGSRSFNVVLVQAQKILRDTFGMDLVELQRDAEETEAEPTQTTGVKKRAAAAGTKSHILRSMLHPTIIDIASQPDEDILEEERKAMPDVDDDEQEGYVRPHGSILAWSGSDNVGAVGILYAILALILVSGKVLNDADLKLQLRRLGLDAGAAVPIGPQATHRTVTIETYLTQVQRQGYLEQSRIGADGVAKKGGAKRGRNANEDDNTQYEWRWGPRAHAEVGEQGIARFMAEFMVEQYDLEAGTQEEDEEEEEEVQETGPSGRMSAVIARKVESAIKGIETAAGGALADVR